MAKYTYTELSERSNSSKRRTVQEKINASVRMFGMPHQLLEHNDPRLGVGLDLGRTYAETFIMEAPTICIKPGIVRYLPGASGGQRNEYLESIIRAADGRGSDLEILLEDKNADNLQYYDHEGKYGSYMKGVNLLAHVMASLLGLENVRVPWAPKTTFGRYDWKSYRLSSLYSRDVEEDSAMDDSDNNWLKSLASSITEWVEENAQYIHFYLDANASFGETMSNASRASILETFTSQVEGLAKELSMIAGTAGRTDVYDELMGKMDSSVSSFVSTLSSTQTWMGDLFSRLGNGAKQIIQGGNFQIPEVYDDSSYDKNYSFSMTLATPYGNKLAWYINIGIVLCHILGMALPLQLSANTFKSPFLLKCFSQGWFNCSLGIIDNISLEKGGDQSWSIYGLPNEVRVSISIKDLYSTLSMPANRMQFIANSGMMEFLMVNCGLDITNQKISNQFKVWVQLFDGLIQDEVSTTIYNFGSGIRDAIADKLLLFT